MKKEVEIYKPSFEIVETGSGSAEINHYGMDYEACGLQFDPTQELVMNIVREKYDIITISKMKNGIREDRDIIIADEEVSRYFNRVVKDYERFHQENLTMDSQIRHLYTEKAVWEDDKASLKKLSLWDRIFKWRKVIEERL